MKHIVAKASQCPIGLRDNIGMSLKQNKIKYHYLMTEGLALCSIYLVLIAIIA